MSPRKTNNEQSSITSSPSPDKSFSSDFVTPTSANSTSKSSKPSKPSPSQFLTIQKSIDILNDYAVSLGVGGYSNLSSSFAKSSTIRQAHSNFLNWLVANNIVSLNPDMVQYISAFLEDFSN